MKVKSYRISEEEFNKMKYFCRCNKITVSALIRIAVLEYIKQKGLVIYIGEDLE